MSAQPGILGNREQGQDVRSANSKQPIAIINLIFEM